MTQGSQDRIGQQLGNYHLLRHLGRGGFADVYLGEHIYLKSQAALKLLHTRLKEDEQAAFLGEAQMLVRMHHPHIVRVLDFALDDDTPFLVMDYAPGGTLRQRYTKGTRLSLETFLPYVQQVASALQYAHDQRLIHRDIKPENMLLGTRDEVLLSDFGLAILAPHTESYSTHAQGRDVAGTSLYLAPEQLQGRPCPESDQYGLAVVVYEWLCGRTPFRGTPIEIAMQHLSASPPSLQQQVPDLSPDVEAVVLRALAKEPHDRFERVYDFVHALEQASGRTPTFPSSSLPFPQVSTLPPSLQEQPEAPMSLLRLEPLWKVPTIFTTLVGREQDVTAIAELLQRPGVRLVTLLGAGGIGKTRLSIQVATAMRNAFSDGVCFVGLASISDPDLLVSSIAQALELPPIGGQSLFEQVKLSLRERSLLLILDNFEQIIAAVSQVEELLAVCPALQIVVTSRALLRVQGEQEFPVAPLALPNLTTLPRSDTLLPYTSQYSAVVLFVQRARATQPNFQLTLANARAIVEICVRLDGLPLAIELAAARIKLLPPQALLSRLSQGLQVLGGGARTLPERQQTLRNTLQWSYDLLDAEEQRLFRRLSVFVGGCTLEAVEAVWKVGKEAERGVLSAFDGVVSLLEKSLLLQVEQEGEEPYLQMLVTVREYGLECLRESGEAEAIQRAHALYYLTLAEEAVQGFRSPQQAEWLNRLAREHDNLRATMEWSLEPAQGGPHLEMAFRLGEALEEFWDVRSFSSEAHAFFERALARSEGVAASVRARALITAARFSFDRGDVNRAEALYKESLVLYRKLGETRGVASSLLELGVIAQNYKAYNIVTVCSLYEESLLIFRELGDKETIAKLLGELADAVSISGDYGTSRALFEESLVMFRELENKRGLAGCLGRSALMLFAAQMDQETMRAQLDESLAIFTELGDKEGLAFCSWLAGWRALTKGDTDTASALVACSLAYWLEVGNLWWSFWALAISGRIETHRGDFVAARAFHEKSLARARELHNDWMCASYLEGLASIKAAQGEEAWAGRLLGAAESLRDRCGVPGFQVERAEYESAVAAARMHLGEQAFAAAWAEGRSMTLEEALAVPEADASLVEQVSVKPQSPTAKSAPSPTYPDELTAREVEVLRLVAQGWTDAQIAERLVISARTVNAHVASIYRKIGVSSRSGATRYAIEKNLLLNSDN